MANKSKSINVYVQVQGQPGKYVKGLSTSATVRQALAKAGFSEREMDAAEGNDGITVDAASANLGSRLKNEQLILVTTKVAGGR
jgi:hypothetical protein